eukprot:TRINITY_DN33236_c0_g1_i1.p1 TRINITY_DN33236_c0_g1~~TRINITY_DN33236_c0_g1_i1.p1  ORF type:complete len:1118 (-),score=164.18 TRINITY_DN33236_c0_g1_i1:116-3469(-)
MTPENRFYTQSLALDLTNSAGVDAEYLEEEVRTGMIFQPSAPTDGIAMPAYLDNGASLNPPFVGTSASMATSPNTRVAAPIGRTSQPLPSPMQGGGSGSSGGFGGSSLAHAEARLTAASGGPSWCDRRPLSGQGNSSSKPTVDGKLLSGRGSPRGTTPPSYQVSRRTSAPAVSSDTSMTDDDRQQQVRKMIGTSSEGSTSQFPNRGDVQLCVRLRPNADDEASCVILDGRNGVRLKQHPGYPQSNEPVYSCDCTFGTDASQEHVYNSAVTRICEAVLRGYNGAVIAYGQTGSGKTHTMLGNPRHRGLSPRAVIEIFNNLSQCQDWSVEVSVLEIYNERVRDLLAPGSGPTHVDVHEVSSGGDGPACFRCPDATNVRVNSPEEALAALADGSRRRETHRTDMNHNSSRSHLIFTVSTTQRDKEVGATLRGRLHLVDLAGSERLKRSMSSERTGSISRQGPRISGGGGRDSMVSGSGSRTPRDARDQRREAGEINKSLSQLALVIQRLTGPSGSGINYVPYRDSVLTRLLAESFGGNSKTTLIITCSTRFPDREETRCSLEFGRRAKQVKNRPEINLEMVGTPTPVLQAMVAKELLDMQRERDTMLQDRELLMKDRASLQARLAEAEARTVEAVNDALVQQDRRVQEVRRLVEEKAQLQQRRLESAVTASEVQGALVAETSRLSGERVEMHEQLEDATEELMRLQKQREGELRLNEVERARACASLEESRKLSEERAQQIASLRVELQRLSAEKAEDLMRYEKESVTLREKWMEDVSRLEAENNSLAEQLEQDRAELPRRVETALRRDTSLLESSPSTCSLPATEPPRARTGSRQAEEERSRLAAWCSERGRVLRSDLEDAEASAARDSLQREALLANLEADTVDLRRRLRSDVVKSGSKASLMSVDSDLKATMADIVVATLTDPPACSISPPRASANPPTVESSLSSSHMPTQASSADPLPLSQPAPPLASAVAAAAGSNCAGSEVVIPGSFTATLRAAAKAVTNGMEWGQAHPCTPLAVSSSTAPSVVAALASPAMSNRDGSSSPSQPAPLQPPPPPMHWCSGGSQFATPNSGIRSDRSESSIDGAAAVGGASAGAPLGDNGTSPSRPLLSSLKRLT